MFEESLVESTTLLRTHNRWPVIVSIATQAAMGALAFGLGLLTVTGIVRLWHVYVFAFLLGCASAFDAPARQTVEQLLADPRTLPASAVIERTEYALAGRFATIATIAEVTRMPAILTRS